MVYFIIFLIENPPTIVYSCWKGFYKKKKNCIILPLRFEWQRTVATVSCHYSRASSSQKSERHGSGMVPTRLRGSCALPRAKNMLGRDVPADRSAHLPTSMRGKIYNSQKMIGNTKLFFCWDKR